MAAPTKCAHSPCTCEVKEGQSYCSKYCEHTATSGPPREEKVCECNHKACTAKHSLS